MRRILLTAPFILFALSNACSTAPSGPASIKWRALVYDAGIEQLSRAASAMALNDYMRYSEEGWHVINRNAGSDPPTPLEREFVLFKLGTLYLFEREAYLWPDAWPKLMPLNDPQGFCHTVTPQVAVEGSQVFARKLSGLPKLHNFSRLFIARVDELDGIPLPSWVSYTSGARRWMFNRFATTE